jgi:hypothetical protein
MHCKIIYALILAQKRFPMLFHTAGSEFNSLHSRKSLIYIGMEAIVLVERVSAYNFMHSRKQLIYAFSFA